MTQKKTMKTWQFTFLSVLLILLGISMFLPVFHINGKTVIKMAKKSEGYKEEMEELAEDGGDAIKEQEEEIKEYEKEIDETIREFEKEYGVKIRSISSFRIMTHSLKKLLSGKELTAEEKKELKDVPEIAKVYKKYNILRVVLWIVYMTALVLLLLTLLGMVLDWSKYVAATMNLLYGVVAVVVFAYLRFGLMGSIAKALNSKTESILGGFGSLIDIEEGVRTVKKMLSALYSVGFLLGFILAVLLVIVSLLTMMLGGSADSIPEPVFPSDGSIFPSGGSGFPSGGSEFSSGGSGFPSEVTFSAQSSIDESAVLPPQAQIPVQTAPMGQVRCTMGCAVGAGFQLPADRKVIVGKSPNNANLVINHPNVSNIHCSIRYNPYHNSYIVKDHSLNGTFVNGVRLQKDIPMEYPAGTVLSLADGTNQITMG